MPNSEIDKNIGRVNPRSLEQEMQESYLDYAMSVIVARALPDVRDGLKPVHRRILYAMSELGLRSNAKFRKSAAVVGEVLAKYHPHGDVAVYDSMVRMAQEFAQRYPLVDGQGNFGCFTKDTQIKLTDGRNLNFEKLIEEYKRGKKNYAYTVNLLGLISIAEIKHPRLTRKKAELLKVTLDNGLEIRCTPDHRFMLKDGSYREARLLTKLDSLMPLYTKISEKTDRLNREGYLLIYQNKTAQWVPAHHLADNYNLSQKNYSKNAGRVRHHVNFNKLNNNPNNIVRLNWGEHWRIHYEQAVQMHQDPEFRKKIASGRKNYWANPNNRLKKAAEVSERNSKNWRNPEYREKMRAVLSEVNKLYIALHPEKRKELSERASRTLKRLWQNPDYQALFRAKIIKGNKNHTTNKTGKLKFLKVCQEAIRSAGIIDEAAYNQARERVYTYGSAPLWYTGLKKYFQNNPDLIRHEINRNHKVVKIQKLVAREDVYDLTIEGSHNFALASGIFVHNSMDGDAPAAMRYTEARMMALAEEMLADLDKETVDWMENYDATRLEPKVLPAKAPNLLLNGTLGIAVGMATNIPPHNLGEIVDATVKLIDEPASTTEDLLEFVKGPDFPTGGFIYDWNTIKQVYATGKGPIIMRARTEIVEEKGVHKIIINEIPYAVNKATLLEQFAALVKDKRIEGIKDLRDESDKDGVRIVIDLKKEGLPNKILNQLFKYSSLQETFHVNMLALVDGIEPQVLNLKNILEYYIKHRVQVVTRRTTFDLSKAKDRAHILEGLKKALDHIDAVIQTIRKSDTTEEAHAALMSKFKLSDKQTTAILQMQLRALAGLERKKVEDELKEKYALIEELESLLKSEKKIRGVVKTELLELKDKYGNPRKTTLVKQPIGEFKVEDLIPEQQAMVIITKSGYVKRLPPDTYKTQGRGGKGVIGMTTKEEDVVEWLQSTNTHDDILFFTTKGRVFATKVYELPEGSRTARGQALVNFLELPSDEMVSSILTISKKTQAKYLVLATKKGLIKKTPLEEFAKVRRSGLIAIKIKSGDELRWVKRSGGDDDVILSTSNGQAIRFDEKDVRAMGRTAAGVKGMRMKKDDHLMSMDLVSKKDNLDNLQLLIITENGSGKKTDLKFYKKQHRGGSGIKTLKVTPKTGKIVSLHVVNKTEEHDLIVISKQGQTLRTPLGKISTLGRATQGVRVMTLDPGDKVATTTLI